MEEAEASMLGSFRDFIIQMDPDIIVGYNIKKFDWTDLLFWVDVVEILKILQCCRKSDKN